MTHLSYDTRCLVAFTVDLALAYRYAKSYLVQLAIKTITISQRGKNSARNRKYISKRA